MKINIKVINYKFEINGLIDFQVSTETDVTKFIDSYKKKGKQIKIINLTPCTCEMEIDPQIIFDNGQIISCEAN